MNTAQTQSPAVKMGGSLRYYFPEFPNHPLNGMYAYGADVYVGDHKGKKMRNVIYGQQGKFDQVAISAEMFDADMVLVKHWMAGDQPEYFYLQAKPA